MLLCFILPVFGSVGFAGETVGPAKQKQYRGILDDSRSREEACGGEDARKRDLKKFGDCLEWQIEGEDKWDKARANDVCGDPDGIRQHNSIDQELGRMKLEQVLACKSEQTKTERRRRRELEKNAATSTHFAPIKKSLKSVC
jgi:hypothetical protein